MSAALSCQKTGKLLDFERIGLQTRFRRDDWWCTSPEGVAWSWYSSGEKFKRYNYSKGAPVGLQQGWRRNGKLFSNFEYKNGRAYGLRNSNLCVELEDEQIAYN